MRGALAIFPVETTKVCFARLDPGQGDFKTAAAPIASNHSSGDTFYLLNADPGRYVAVVSLAAGMDPASGARETERDLTLLPEDLVRMTDVAAEPGLMAFMGEYRVHSFGGLADADAPQKFYAGILAPAPGGSDLAVLGIRVVPLAGTPPVVSRGRTESARRDAEAEERFRAAARDHLVDAAWGAVAVRGRR